MLFQKNKVNIINSTINSLYVSSGAPLASGSMKKKRLHEAQQIILSSTALLLTLFVACSAFKSDPKAVPVLALEALNTLINILNNLNSKPR